MNPYEKYSKEDVEKFAELVKNMVIRIFKDGFYGDIRISCKDGVPDRAVHVHESMKVD